MKKTEIRQFRKDEGLLKEALSKAEKEFGFRLNMIQLVAMLLTKACNGSMLIKVVKTNFNYGDYTSIRYNSEKLKEVKALILEQGFTAPFNFLINHMFFSYINNK